MESTPARMATLAPSAPWAWAATFLRRRCASSTMASISAWLSCGVSTSSASDSTPPVAHTLMTSAPYLTWYARRRGTGRRRLAMPSPMPGSLPKEPVGEAGAVAVAAARAEGVDGDQHARAGDDAVGDGVAQPDVDVVARAHVAHGGEAGDQRPARVLGGADGVSGMVRRRSSISSWCQSSADSPVRCVWASMSPGSRVASPRSMTPRRREWRRARRAPDLPVLDDHHGVAHHGVGAPVEHPLRLQHGDGGTDPRVSLGVPGPGQRDEGEGEGEHGGAAHARHDSRWGAGRASQSSQQAQRLGRTGGSAPRDRGARSARRRARARCGRARSRR